MEFRNLTPFDAVRYGTLDVHDEEHHVVAIKLLYQLAPTTSRADGSDGGSTHVCELLTEGDETSLHSRDLFEGEVNASSVRAESDRAPCKPRCDVLVRATAWAPGGRTTARWSVRVRVSSPESPLPTDMPDAPRGVLVDKTLEVCGPRWFERTATGWELTAPTPTLSVPIRWENAFGGRSHVPSFQTGEAPLLDEVCFTNPLGTGWIEARYLDTLERAGVPAPNRIPAPQIEHPHSPVTSLVTVSHPNAPVDAPKMAEIARGYGVLPAGLGCVGRRWTRVPNRAGTYDTEWVKRRHPFLPTDFSFAYWNAAPDNRPNPASGPRSPGRPLEPGGPRARGRRAPLPSSYPRTGPS